jgi:hypothetical protein
MKKNMEIGFIFSFDDVDNSIKSVEDFDEHVIEFYSKTRNYLTSLFTNSKLGSNWREKYPNEDYNQFINNALNDTQFYQVVKTLKPPIIPE